MNNAKIMPMANLIDSASLNRVLDEGVSLIDVRYKLGGKEPNWGKQAYKKGHIPSAVYFDLNEDLSATPKEHGGRHPLVDIDKFAKQLGDSGIDSSTKVVIYDDNAGAFAGRMWWMLKYIGHKDMMILDGGYSAWLEAKLPIETKIPKREPCKYDLNIQKDLLVDMEYVKANISKLAILDARGRERYLGQNEHLDPKAGHIPSALSFPYTDNLIDNKFKSKKELKERFKEFKKEQEIILYCGSGVTACHNFLVLDSLGYKNLKLYIGSWSDWVSYPENPIEIGA